MSNKSDPLTDKLDSIVAECASPSLADFMSMHVVTERGHVQTFLRSQVSGPMIALIYALHLLCLALLSLLIVIFAVTLFVSEAAASVDVQNFEIVGSEGKRKPKPPTGISVVKVTGKTAARIIGSQRFRVISTVAGVPQSGWIVNSKLQIDNGVLYITWQPDPDPIFQNGFEKKS